MNRKLFRNMTAVLAAAIMTVASAGTAFAANPVIDTTKTAGLTIVKYDLTTAAADGITGYGTTAGTGEVNTTAETELADYALEGVEFTYVKVADIAMETVTETGATSQTVKMMYTNIPTDLKTALGLTGDAIKYSSDDLNTAIAAAVGDVAKKNALETYVAGATGKATLTTDGDGKASVSGLPLGLYLVVETKVPRDVNTTTAPFFVSLPMTTADGDDWLYDVTVYPKNQTNLPTIDKVVKQSEETTFGDTTTASVGDIVDYKIVSKLPTISSKATYLTKYTYVDTASKGLSYKQDSTVTVKFYESAENAKADSDAVLTLTSPADFTVAYGTATGDKTTMTVTMTAAGLEKINVPTATKPSMSDKFMAVSYQATITSDAVLGDTGNPNDVTLTYSRTNESSSESIGDEAKVYTYGIDLQKNFSATGADATAVTFKLDRIETDAAGTETEIPVKAIVNNGIYTVSSADTAKADDYHPTSAGKLDIRGLEAGTYRLTETKTASGYVLLKSPVTVVITSSSVTITPSAATHTVDGEAPEVPVISDTTPATATVNGDAAAMSTDNGSANALVTFAVLNNKGFELPKTGGWGTILFTMIGAAGLALGTLMLRRRKRS